MSILGTWSGPQWTPTQNLASVLISIQSLMSEEPYYNEPGYEHRKNNEASAKYNESIVHETLRCAVCDVVERNFDYPNELFELVKETFIEQYEDYIKACNDNASKDGKRMFEHSGPGSKSFQYENIKSRLEALMSKLSSSPSTSNS